MIKSRCIEFANNCHEGETTKRILIEIPAASFFPHVHHAVEKEEK